jgi:hypothetical protein
MANTFDAPSVRGDGELHITWSAAIAGAIAATALSFVFLTFAAALGLSVGSSAPTWRDASMALWLLTGLYLILQAMVSFGFGGYVAGRLRRRWSTALSADETDFRDGMHGLLVWALGALLGAIVLGSTLGGIATRATPATVTSPQPATAGEPLIAYELDRLFRGAREGDLTAARSEAGRILLHASGHRGIVAEDRAHLTRVVSARTGLAQGDAEKRVDDVVARARDAIVKARKTGVLLGFVTAASLLLGAAAAWFAACLGGRHRDGDRVPSFTTMNWSGTRPTTTTTTIR